MAVQGVDIRNRLLLDASQAVGELNKSLKGMLNKTKNFAGTMDRYGRLIEGTWWKRFGAVALGFTLAYRAMNLFEGYLGRLVTTFGDAVKMSGEFIDQQAKMAFWMQTFSETSYTFEQAFNSASVAMGVLKEEALRSASSVAELTTGIDELAQAGVPITSKLIPAMVSLVDFTAMVAQTTGSTTRQIRQEFQALMDGSVRVTNQLVRVLKNMGILTEENLKDLRSMTNRAEILDKVLGAIHERWLEIMSVRMRANVELSMTAWEKAIQLIHIRAIEMASQIAGVPNLFAEVFFKSRKEMKLTNDQWERLVRTVLILRDGLNFLVGAFEDTLNAATAAFTIGRNLVNIIKDSDLARVAAYGVAIGGLASAVRGLGAAFMWLAAKPVMGIASAFKLLLSPIMLVPVAIYAATVAIRALAKILGEDLYDAIGKVSKRFQSLIDYYREKLPEALEGVGILIGKIFPKDEVEELRNLRVAVSNELKRLETNVEALHKSITEKGFTHKKYLWLSNQEAVIESLNRQLEETNQRLIHLRRHPEDIGPGSLTRDFAERFGLESLKIIQDDLERGMEIAKIQLGLLMDAEIDLKDAIGPTNEELKAQHKQLMGIAESAAEVKKRLRALEYLNKELARLTKTSKEFAEWIFLEKVKELRKVLENLREIDVLEKLGLKEIEKDFGNLASIFEDATDSWKADLSDFLVDFAQGTASMQEFFENMLHSLQRSLADFLADEVIRKLFGEAGATGFIGGLLGYFKSTKALPGPGPAGPSFPAGVLHRGGVVGLTPTPKRLLPTSVISAAPRLHTGLKSDEFPAILRKGETVSPKGKSPIDNVFVLNQTSSPAEVRESRNIGGGKDVHILIGEAAAMDIASGGPLFKSMRNTFGLRPNVLRR
jgi:hypothetical protein